MGVDGGDDIEQAGYDDEFGSVVGGCYLNSGLAEVEDAGEDVKDAVAKIADEVEDVEDLAGVWGVDLSFEGEPDREHGEDGDGDKGAADPFAKHEVACAGNEPASDEDHRRE